jgi:hypothetical protein
MRADMKSPRERAKHRKAGEPGTTAPEPAGATRPSRNRMTGLSPERLETLGRLGVALLEAITKLIDAIGKLH